VKKRVIFLVLSLGLAALGAQEGVPLPRSFRSLALGMSLEDLKSALTADPLFAFRGDRDVSFLPVRSENLVETTGMGLVRSAFFQLRDGAVYIMAFTFDTARMDHYSVFTTLQGKYGEPDHLDPRESRWEREGLRLSLERPLTVKYIDMEVFNTLIEEAQVQESAEIHAQQDLLDAF
jgi:hypothetical protein